jgi:hypothetical protein
MERRPEVKENEMKDNLDSILATEPELIPSSGFLASVMERVEEESAAPPPIPFPWKRAIPGMIVAAGVLGWGGVELVRYAVQAAPTISLHQPALPVPITAHMQQAGWVVVACAVSVASWLLSRRLAGRSGLI